MLHLFQLRDVSVEIISENGSHDAKAETVFGEETLTLYLRANESRPEYVILKWRFASPDSLLVMGDEWERSYGEMGFHALHEARRAMPWYFIATNRTDSFCFGVKTGCNSFVSFRYDTQGITALVDCRNGGSGVRLGGRRIELATFLLHEYRAADPFDCLCDFCRRMCDRAILPDAPVYGGNNWYYAYGKSSYEEIIGDTRVQVELSKGLANRPFMVVDDCWQINSCAGPWLPNEKFGDMKRLFDEIRAMGARPGAWIRLLRNHDPAITGEMRIERGGERIYLDPTHPAVQEYIRADIARLREWGCEMMKHDFSTMDLFGMKGDEVDETVTNISGWHFYDDTKTNAEIVLDLYRLIRRAAGDMLIIGCNTVSHLSAGLVHIYRTGDDTSGREWERTKRMGVNTLAFRLAQNDAFYRVDADCVGILEDKIPWEKNRQWLDLLANSGTALFISCNNSITPEMREDIAAAYKTINRECTARPLDWLTNRTPEQWRFHSYDRQYRW